VKKSGPAICLLRKSSFVLSFAIVAFGQPAWIPLFGVLAALVGYALFWNVCLFFDSKWGRFWGAFSWYAAVQGVQLSWMTSIEFQGIYILFVYFFLLLWLGLQFGLLTLFIPKRGELTLFRIVAIAALWALIEWSRLHYFFCGFSWNPVGLALTSFDSSLQWASIWGIFGLSFWVMLVNGVFLKWLHSVAKKAPLFCLWISLGALPYLFGAIHIAHHQQKMKSYKDLSIALIETGLLPNQKNLFTMAPNAYVEPFEQWRRILSYLKSKSIQKYDLIVFPEAAVPFLADRPIYPLEYTKKILIEGCGEEVQAFFPPLIPPFAHATKRTVSNLYWAKVLSDFYQAELILGADYRDHGSHKNYQSAFYLSPGSLEPKIYKKRLLLPLAEYLPFSFLRVLTQAYGITEFYTQGTETKVFSEKVPLSISICYEETFGDLIREGRSKGAHLFVNSTNDNWYPASRLGKQHFDHARLRSIENGVPLVRACNMGVTAAIDSLGRIIHCQKGNQGDLLVTSLSSYHYPTLYTFWGDKGILIPSFIFLTLFALFNRRKASKGLDQKASFS
jgi:apolipoprotein N-acyltransferase